MNTLELKGRIVAKGFSIEGFCKATHIVRATFDRKMAGKTEFTRDEIERIIGALDLSAEETRAIFFTETVA